VDKTTGENEREGALARDCLRARFETSADGDREAILGRASRLILIVVEKRWLGVIVADACTKSALL